MLRAGLIAITALGLAACASTGQTEGQTTASDDCFRNSQVTGYEVIDAHHVRVRAGATRSYILTTNWDTSTLNWTFAIQLRSTTDRICVGNGLGVQIIGGDPPQTYSVSGIARATDDAAPTGS